MQNICPFCGEEIYLVAGRFCMSCKEDLRDYLTKECIDQTKTKIKDAYEISHIGQKNNRENNKSCFDIRDGVLVAYSGQDCKVEIPDGVTKIGTWVFRNCNILEEVIIPNSVTEIGLGAFIDCCNLKKIEIPDSVRYIWCAFAGCSSLEEIRIPNGVTELFEGTFADCSSLRNVDIPESVKSIEDEVFKGCSSLKQVTIPSDCTYFSKLDLEGLDVFVGSFPEWCEVKKRK